MSVHEGGGPGPATMFGGLDASTGRAFGSRYLLGEVIGRGATGRVHRAMVRDTGEQVAVKILREDLSSRPDAVAKFVQERQVLRAVTGPHIVRVHDLVVEGDELGIVMDLVTGGDLRRAVQTPCPPEFAAALAVQIADGLASAHAAGVIHRDLKPDNVLVEYEGDGYRLRLTDFGLSHILQGNTSTKVTSVAGTPGYLAPEVAGGGRAGHAADLYALGIMIYELCAGRAPFSAENPLALLLAHIREEPQRPPGMPDALWHLVSQLLSKTPAERPSAEAAGRALRAIAGMPDAPPAGYGDDQVTRLGMLPPSGALRPVPPPAAADT